VRFPQLELEMTMSEPLMLFETDPLLGTPKLRAVNGAARTWSAKELCQLEEQLRPRYDGLVRAFAGTLEFMGRTLHVKKKEGDSSRQPTLELRSTEADTVQATAGSSKTPLPVPASALAWGQGFLAELDRLFATVEFDGILPVEKAMLRLVRDELQRLLDKSPGAEAALLVLVSILTTAEYLSRTQQPQEPHPYAYALSGVEWLLSRMTVSAQTPWGRVSARPNSQPLPSWLGRFWNRVTGAS
jgi:hypothetical protein